MQRRSRVNTRSSAARQAAQAGGGSATQPQKATEDLTRQGAEVTITRRASSRAPSRPPSHAPSCCLHTPTIPPHLVVTKRPAGDQAANRHPHGVGAVVKHFPELGRLPGVPGVLSIHEIQHRVQHDAHRQRDAGHQRVRRRRKLRPPPKEKGDKHGSDGDGGDGVGRHPPRHPRHDGRHDRTPHPRFKPHVAVLDGGKGG